MSDDPPPERRHLMAHQLASASLLPVSKLHQDDQISSSEPGWLATPLNATSSSDQ